MNRTQNPQSQRNPMNLGPFYATGEISIHVLDSNSNERNLFKENSTSYNRPGEHLRKHNLLPQQTNRNCNYRNNSHRMFANQNHRMYYHSQPKEVHSRTLKNQVNNVASNSKGCLINGIKNIYNQLMHPQLQYDFYSGHNRTYNPKHRNNYTLMNNKSHYNNNKSNHNNQPKKNTNLQNARSERSFTENKINLGDNNRSHEIVAIFTSEDFPELPTPRKKFTDSLNFGKSCTFTRANKIKLENKSARKNKYPIKKPENNEMLIDFVILSAHSPEVDSKKRTKNGTEIRQRQISECSDDSFIICFDSNAEEGVIEFSDDSATDKSNSSEYETDSDDNDRESNRDEANSEKVGKIGPLKIGTIENSKIKNDKTENYDSLSDGTSQPDSGFDDGKDKKVRFNLKPEIHVMHTWDFAYRAARKGHWETYSRDRFRFKNRIEKVAATLCTILDINHREYIFKTRFCDK